MGVQASISFVNPLNRLDLVGGEILCWLYERDLLIVM